MLGSHETGTTGAHLVTWKNVVQERLDNKTLKAEHPALYKKYANQTSCRRLTIKNFYRESRISFAECQAFLLTGSTSKPVANFAPVDAWLDLTRKELTNQILEQISTCYAVSSSRYLLDMALLAYCQENPKTARPPCP